MLSGYRTYIVGFSMIVPLLLTLYGIDVSKWFPQPAELALQGVAFVFLRAGVAKATGGPDL
ncbi:MAG: hypothetical protein GC184_04775 [Rhizobiales bacterium]|nr:hypothetical protein [Hyphomicrobiales bacterium]